METKKCDIAVLGGGPGGLPAAKQVAVRGKKVCLIEKDKLGGVCLNVGCMSTKAMLHAGELAAGTREFGQFGFSKPEISVDGEKFMTRVHGVINQLRENTQKSLQKYENIELLRGRGSFDGPHRLKVENPDSGTVFVEAQKIIIAVGASSIKPGFLPWDSPRLWTSSDALTADRLPESILIMGGGVIGCEFACIYAELGIETTVIEMKDRLLDMLDDDDISCFARDILIGKGVKVVTGRKVDEMLANGDHVITRLPDGTEYKSRYALIAVGRKANLDDINLKSTGVETAKGIIPVDRGCRTNIEHIYAAGDAAEAKQYTHLANRMGLVAGDNAAGFDNCDDRTIVPVGIYLHPNIAQAGLNEQQAKERYPDVKVLQESYETSGTALAYAQTCGMIKLMIDNCDGRVLGAVWIGVHATDMIHELVLAMRTGLTVVDIYRSIHAHPTFQELLKDVIEPWIRDKRILCPRGE